MILNIKWVCPGPFKLVILFTLLSCSKTHYVIKQGLGQMKILTKARPNAEILKDVRVSERSKEKIKKISIYKAYFYNYWNKKPGNIYSKTYILDQKAVTYLVITSPKNKVEALKECFPIMGCFPYLGFYQKKDANSYVEQKKESSFSTYMRPVYAYSTLGHFTDPILSSFFYFSDQRLAELIFHELFHTIFFIKDEVELNENLANYFGKEMMLNYFSFSKEKIAKMKRDEISRQKISRYIVDSVKKLNQFYQEKGNLKDFLEKFFLPGLKSICANVKMSCTNYLDGWNNARFAAYLTYEKKAELIKSLHLKSNLSLKDFFVFIDKKHKEYQEENGDHKSFSSYLLGAN